MQSQVGVSWCFITSVFTVRSVMEFDLIPMHSVNLRTDLFFILCICVCVLCVDNVVLKYCSHCGMTIYPDHHWDHAVCGYFKLVFT